MAKALITFSKSHRQPIEVEVGSNLMTVLLSHGVPVASSCNGDGVCAKCRIQIKSGGDQLSPLNETELHLRDRESLKPGIRFSCQVHVMGNIEIDTPYW